GCARQAQVDRGGGPPVTANPDKERGPTCCEAARVAQDIRIWATQTLPDLTLSPPQCCGQATPETQGPSEGPGISSVSESRLVLLSFASRCPGKGQTTAR